MSKSVSFIHLRTKNNFDNTTSCKGGVTIAFEYYTNTKVVVKAAIARCHENDNYNKRLGRIKSRGRLNSPRLCIYPDTITKQDFIEETLRAHHDLQKFDTDPFYGYPFKGE